MLVCSAAGGVLATWEKHTATLWSVANVTRAAGSSSSAAAASRIPQPLRLRHTKALTCVSVDPGERRLAAGDSTGRVLIWHGIHTAVAAMTHDGAGAGGAGGAPGGGGAGSGAHIQVTTLHWHAGPVACVSWSPDGSRLLSGGGESVLVLWRPEEGTKTFLPRLGGPLSWLSHCDADAAQLALGCGDNAAHVVNLATMKVAVTVRGAAPALLTAPQQQAGGAVFEHPCGPVWDARTGCVVLPAAGGALQWYDMATDAGAGYVHITEAGRQPSLAPPPPTDGAPSSSKAGLHRRPVEPHVCGASLGPGGGVLVTVDRIGEGSSGDDLTRVTDTLRFWRLADAEGGGAGATSPVYVLTTRVDAPHGGATITSVHHAPVPGWAVTTSAGGCDFRLWTCGASQATQASWRCRSVGFYQKRPMSCAAFSADASLLAVGAKDAVTVWEPRSNALVAVLYPVPPSPSSGLPSSIQFLAFLSPQHPAGEHPGAPSPLLCAVWDAEQQQGNAAMPAGGGMCVYDLLTLQAVRRHSPLGGRVLSCAADAGGASVAVLMQPALRQQAQAQSPPPPLVLHFSGPSAALTAAWALRSDGPASQGSRLVFVPRAAVARHPALGGVKTAASSLDGSSLVVVTSDRRFILAPLPQDDALVAQAGAAGEPAGVAWGTARTPDPGAKAPRDGLGDAFGSLRVTPGDPRPLFTGATPGIGGGGGGGGQWVSPLADVPSHALPPLTAILPLYLDALLKASEPAASA